MQNVKNEKKMFMVNLVTLGFKTNSYRPMKREARAQIGLLSLSTLGPASSQSKGKLETLKPCIC